LGLYPILFGFKLGLAQLVGDPDRNSTFGYLACVRPKILSSNVHDVHQLFPFMGISRERYTLITFTNFHDVHAKSNSVGQKSLRLSKNEDRRSPSGPGAQVGLFVGI